MDSEVEILQQLAAAPELLQQASTAGSRDLRTQTRLREQYPAELVRAALTQGELRQKAAAKFTQAGAMWFDRPELEQATPEQVAEYKAQRFQTVTTEIVDLYCGCGSNAMGLARTGRPVLALDPSPAACLRAKWNADLYGLGNLVEIRQADHPLQQLPSSSVCIHLQPQLKAGRPRAVRLEDGLPALEQLLQLPESSAGGAITLSPASNFGGKFAEAEIELISLQGDCREAVVWYGSLRTESAMRATLLPSRWSLAGNPWEHRARIGPPAGYLYDPDPAIVRAGLVDLLAEQLGLSRLDDAEEFLTGPEPITSPAVTAYEILAELPNNDRALRNHIRAAGFGTVEIRCRHVPVDAEALRRKLPLSGTRSGVVIFARLAGKARILICRRIPAAG
jgi:hypothetical protein